VGLLECVQRRAMKIDPGDGKPSCGDRLRAGAVQVEKRRLWSDLIAAFSI